MAEEKRISINNEEYCNLLMQLNDLLFGVAELQTNAMLIVGQGLEHKTPLGNPFYKGEAREGMEQYYTMLAVNIGTLNQFYSKLGEYMIYIQEEMNILDEYIANYISKQMEGGQKK